MESISKAYQALTDPISRENFEKYGHPDGRQVMYREMSCNSLCCLSTSTKLFMSGQVLKVHVIIC